MVAPGNESPFVAIGNLLPPLGVMCEVWSLLVLLAAAAEVVLVGVASANRDTGTGTGGGAFLEGGGGVLGLGGRCSWGDLSGLDGWGAT